MPLRGNMETILPIAPRSTAIEIDRVYSEPFILPGIPTRLGWQCGQCHTVWNPAVLKCDCDMGKPLSTPTDNEAMQRQFKKVNSCG